MKSPLAFLSISAPLPQKTQTIELFWRAECVKAGGKRRGCTLIRFTLECIESIE